MRHPLFSFFLFLSGCAQSCAARSAPKPLEVSVALPLSGSVIITHTDEDIYNILYSEFEAEKGVWIRVSFCAHPRDPTEWSTWPVHIVDISDVSAEHAGAKTLDL